MDLKNQQNVGVSDPYVNIEYAGAIRVKTDVCNATLTPLWNETSYIMIQDTALKGKLFMTVWDWNNLQSDKKMGSTEFDLKQLLVGEVAGKSADPSVVRNIWLPIQLHGKQCGKLRVELSYYGAIQHGTALSAGGMQQQSQIAHESMLNSGIATLSISNIELNETSTDDSKTPTPYLELYNS